MTVPFHSLLFILVTVRLKVLINLVMKFLISYQVQDTVVHHTFLAARDSRRLRGHVLKATIFYKLSEKCIFCSIVENSLLCFIDHLLISKYLFVR